MKVVIDRSKWNSGLRWEDTGLLNDTGQRCCLGFLGRACGLADEKAIRCGYPRDASELRDWPAQLFAQSPWCNATLEHAGNWDWEDAFAAMNDARDIDHPTRESWIAEGFKTVLGVDVEFVGSYE